MTFKAGRTAEVLLSSQDISAFLYSAEWNSYVDTVEVTTFKSLWRSFISGNAFSQLFTYGYYDPTLTNIRAQLQAAAGVVSYAPSGATAIGDVVRLISINSTGYKESPQVSNAIPFTWRVNSTTPVGMGVSLHPLASENLGTITGTGDGCGNGGAATTTGGIGHLHVTAVSSAVSSSFKFQDATTLGGAYTDIASGAFTNMTAVGAQRLIIPGTIRQFVRCVAVIGPATTTYAVSFART